MGAGTRARCSVPIAARSGPDALGYYKKKKCGAVAESSDPGNRPLVGLLLGGRPSAIWQLRPRGGVCIAQRGEHNSTQRPPPDDGSLCHRRMRTRLLGSWSSAVAQNE